MRSMIRSHDIAMQLVAEHQRDLRASSDAGSRLSFLFGRRSAAPEPVPAAETTSAAGSGQAAAADPALRTAVC